MLQDGQAARDPFELLLIDHGLLSWIWKDLIWIIGRLYRPILIFAPEEIINASYARELSTLHDSNKELRNLIDKTIKCHLAKESNWQNLYGICLEEYMCSHNLTYLKKYHIKYSIQISTVIYRNGSLKNIKVFPSTQNLPIYRSNPVVAI